MHYNLVSFGNKLVELRQVLGYSQSMVSELSGVNMATLSRIESGKVILKQETLDFLSLVYKRDLNRLLLEYRFNNFSKYIDIKNRMESKLDKEDVNTLEIELNDFKSLLSITENSYSRITINQMILLIESVILSKIEKNQKMALEKLVEALKISNPEFSIHSYSSLVYSSMEIRILMNIAIIINKIESTEKSLEILKFCFENVESNESIYAKICYNLSYDYHRLDDHKNALKYASLGIEYCLNNRDFNGLNLLYFREGIAKFLLNHEDYLESLSKALSQCKILGQEKLAELMINSCKKNYNIEL